MANHEKTNDENKLILIAVIILIICLSICGLYYAYAKYVSTESGTANATIANIVCDLEITPSAASNTIVNPYCTVVAKNYNASGRTQTDLEYTIEVVSSDGSVLPPFRWKNAQGTVIATSADTVENGVVVARTASFPVQTFTHDSDQRTTFTIEFINTGDQFTGQYADAESIQRLVDFNIVAVQKGSN